MHNFKINLNRIKSILVQNNNNKLNITKTECYFLWKGEHDKLSDKNITYKILKKEHSFIFEIKCINCNNDRNNFLTLLLTKIATQQPS